MENPEIISTILKPYKPAVHFLKSFELYGGNKMKGKFQPKSSFYSVDRLNHLASTELQICLDQLIYAFAVKKGFIDDLEGNEFSNDLREIQNNNSYISSLTVNFRKEIDPAKEINGEIELLYDKKIDNNWFLYFDYNFENGKFYGKLTAVMIL